MKYFVLFLLITAFVCCTRQNDERLLSAESFLPDNPQNADSILKGMSDMESLSDADKALYGILRTYTDNRLGHEVDNDSLIRPSYNYYYDKHIKGELTDTASLRHYAQCCYYMGLYYAACDSTKQREDKLRSAVKLGEQSRDWHTSYLSYYMLSECMQLCNKDSAVQYAFKAVELYNKVNDDINNLPRLYSRIGGAYVVSGDFDNAIKYYKEGYEIAKQHNLTIVQNELCMGIAGTYMGMGATDNALEYAKIGITTASGKAKVNSQMVLAQCYATADSLTQSAEILRAIVCDSNDYVNRYLVMRYLADITMRTKEYESASTYVDSAFVSLENLYYHSLQVKDKYYQDNIQKEVRKEKLSREKERARWQLLFALTASIIAIVFLYLRFKVLRGKERRKRYTAIKNERYKNGILLRDQEAKERQIAERQKEIEHQRALLEQKSVSMKLIQKYLLDRLDGVSTLMDGGERVSISDETWIEIEKCINMTDGNFMERLRTFHSDFSEEDYRLCMLVRLKIENEMIGKLYNITVSAVKKRKSGLKKNGFMVTDPKVDLNQIINEI